MLEWTCHICGKLRPDNKISVHSRIINHGGFEIKENVRYCNDNSECIEGAKTKTWLGDDK
jgi:hypothetical protein